MNPKSAKIKIISKILKAILVIGVYVFFTIYTMPIYNKVRAFVDEKITAQKRAVVIGSTSIFVDVADTQEERIQGLSGRESLEDNQGMLFIFEESDKHGIWMKDMKFSIDVIWFNEYGEVIYFVEKARPESYPKTFSSSDNSRYVLEVPAGFIKREGIKMGDRIDLF